MTIKRRQPYGPISTAALSAFEGRLVAPLPADLRNFLLEFNGAHFTDSTEFDDVPGGTALEDIFGLHCGPTYLRLDEMQDAFALTAPQSLVVIASDPYGNYFATWLAGIDRGAVYFVDHEQLPLDRGSMHRVAGSFSELLERAGSALENRPAPNDVADALQHGDVAALREMIAAGVSARGCVHSAVHHGDLRAVQAVLDGGGDPNELGGIGGTETPLFVAARTGRADIAQLLIDRGGDPNVRCSAGGTAMEMALHFENVLVVLVRAGADPTTPALRDATRRIAGRG